jgi:hypothetical protein
MILAPTVTVYTLICVRRNSRLDVGLRRRADDPRLADDSLNVR